MRATFDASLTPEELLAVLKVARRRSTRDWAMTLLAYRHGLRASEACGMKLADVDLRSGSLSVHRLKGSLHTVQPLYHHKGQPLLDEVTAMRAWLRERNCDGSDYLFTSQKGGRLIARNFSASFERALRRPTFPSKSGTRTASSIRSLLISSRAT
jgi:integrase